MSIAVELPAWDLSDHVRVQLAEQGITLSQLFRLLEHPTLRIPAVNGDGQRWSGYGLTALVRGHEVIGVGLDGADANNWKDWAVEAAEFADGDVLGADALVSDLARRVNPFDVPGQRRRRQGSARHPVTIRTMATRPSPPVRAVPTSPFARTVERPAPVQRSAWDDERDDNPLLIWTPQEIRDLLDPSIRDSVIQAADGDLSRLVIHSPTQVDVKPAQRPLSSV